MPWTWRQAGDRRHAIELDLVERHRGWPRARLIAEAWRQLAKGKKVGAALRDARIAFVKKWLAQSGAKERPYILKTALQIQLYGNPEGKL